MKTNFIPTLFLLTLPINAIIWASTPTTTYQKEKYECPSKQRVKINLQYWKAEIEKASGNPRLLATKLSLLDLQPVPASEDNSLDPDQLCSKEPVLKGVDIFSVNLADEDKQDKIIQARFDTCPENYTSRMISLRIQILHPLGSEEWCLLGNDLSLDQMKSDEPCAGKAEKLPRVFAFKNLTNANRKVIEIKDQGGNCEGAGRSAIYKTSFWEVQGYRISNIFEVETYKVGYQSPTPPTKEINGDISIYDDFPKKILYTKKVVCRKPDKDAINSDVLLEPCNNSTEKKLYVYKNGKYVLK